MLLLLEIISILKPAIKFTVHCNAACGYLFVKHVNELFSPKILTTITGHGSTLHTVTTVHCSVL